MKAFIEGRDEGNGRNHEAVRLNVFVPDMDASLLYDCCPEATRRIISELM